MMRPMELIMMCVNRIMTGAAVKPVAGYPGGTRHCPLRGMRPVQRAGA